MSELDNKGFFSLIGRICLGTADEQDLAQAHSVAHQCAEKLELTERQRAPVDQGEVIVTEAEEVSGDADSD